MKKALYILVASAFVLINYRTHAFDQRLQAAAEACMVKLLDTDSGSRGKTGTQAFFVPAGAESSAVTTFLAEALITAIVDEPTNTIGLGGSVDSTSLAEGLRLALESTSELLGADTPNWKGVQIVYFTKEKDTRYIRRVADDHGINMTTRNLDMGSFVGIEEAGCRVR